MTLTLPDEFLELLESNPQPELEMRIRLAAQFYASGEVGLEQGAELAGLKRWQFEQWLHAHDVAIPWSKEDMEQELAAVRDLAETVE